jgi:hypothetical protein
MLTDKCNAEILDASPGLTILLFSFSPVTEFVTGEPEALVSVMTFLLSTLIIAFVITQYDVVGLKTQQTAYISVRQL